MTRIFTFLLSIIITSELYGLNIPQGTFYFDNSFTKYDNVKFVYGKQNEAESHVISMAKETDTRWKITIPQMISGIYRYTFANTKLDDGIIYKTFQSLKDEISLTRKEYRTATTDAEIIVDGIYTPVNGDNWAQGEWKLITNNQYGYSKTLPVMFINTIDKAPIVSKEDYIKGSYYIDNMGLSEYKSIGSIDTPLPLQIKGRGNYTWQSFDKKPYRIKLENKADLLGLKKSKHFALLAHADDNLGFLRNHVGFELSRQIGLKWTSEDRPIEVVLNGSYIGLYFLIETIRVDKDRVNILEQPDLCEDQKLITGGWIVEIDNYDTDPHISIFEGNGNKINFTYKSPESLSSLQSTYLANQMNNINSALFISSKQSTVWENYVDLDQLARFYIVQEIMDNTESFHGSCYMYKDIDNDIMQKWNFGPVWDFGCTFQRNSKKYIYQDSPFGQTWIEEICKFPHFMSYVKDIWRSFLGTGYTSINGYIDDFKNKISSAAKYDAIRWPKYGNSNMDSKTVDFKNKLSASVNWLISKWGESGIENVVLDSDISIVNGDNCISVISPNDIISSDLYDLSGRLIYHGNASVIYAQKGIYILELNLAGEIYRKKVIIK